MCTSLSSEVVDYVSHEALLLEVQRLEAALGSIRADLQGVEGCQGRCGQLENIQNMVCLCLHVSDCMDT